MLNIEKLIELLKKAQGDRSQNEFALHSEVSSATITKILKSERFPSPKILKKLAEKAHNGVTYEQLMQAAGYVDSNKEKELEQSERFVAPSTFNERIKYLRTINNAPLKNIAKYVDVSVDTYQEYESGEKIPALIEEITKIANYFDVSLDYLMCRSDDPKLDQSLLGKYFDGYSDLGEAVILVRENGKNFAIMAFEKYLRIKNAKKEIEQIFNQNED